VQADARPVVLAGTALFLLGFVGLLPFWGWLGTHHHRVWIETALAGWLLGLVGLLMLAKHRRAGRTR
jgi:Protein of unknown function (DUF2530)